MWIVGQLRFRAVELDFTSSFGTRRAATAVDADGVTLFNAIDLIDVDEHRMQVEVCGCCGYAGCSPGGWVELRRVDELVVWIPAWTVLSQGAWESTEMRPPAFFESRGAPVFTAANWETLRSIQQFLPAANEIPVLDSREAVRLLQWSAPGRVLGVFPDRPKLLRALLIATSETDIAATADLLDASLREHFDDPCPMELVREATDTAPIELWLDVHGTPGWAEIARTVLGLGILVAGGPSLIRRSTSGRDSRPPLNADAAP